VALTAETQAKLAALRGELVHAPAAPSPVPRQKKPKPAAGELVLRRAVGPWSAGTPVRVLGGIDDGDGVVVEPVDRPGDEVVASKWDVVVRRRGSTPPRRVVAPPEPESEPPLSPPAPRIVERAGERRLRTPVPRGGVVVTATRTALEQAQRRGVERLEAAVERAILEGRKRRTMPGGRRLDEGLRHVLLDERCGAVVAKLDVTAGGRRRYRVLRLVALRPLPRRRIREAA
jgi:hypothetical protein